MKKRCMTAVLCAAMLLTGCGKSLSGKTKPIEIKPLDGSEEFCTAQLEFACSLLHRAAEETDGENLLFSPYLAAEAYLAAANFFSPDDTPQEAFGGMQLAALNGSFVKWRSTQDGLTEAMSLWLPEDSAVDAQDRALRLGAGLCGLYAERSLPSPDAVGRWVKEATGGAVTEIAAAQDQGTSLLGTAVLELKWNETYSDNEVKNMLFTCADGTQKSVPFLSKDSDTAVLLEDDSIRGLRRNCQNHKYAFLALMPKSGDVDGLLGTLTPEQLSSYIRGGAESTLRTGIPKLEAEDTSQILSWLGIPVPGGSGQHPLRIGQAVQHVRLVIGQGTAEAEFKMDLGESETARDQIILDHPFVYFIVDRQYGLPVFAGTVRQTG